MLSASLLGAALAFVDSPRRLKLMARLVVIFGFLPASQGSNDLLMGDVLRTHEQQVWFLAEHLVDAPTVRAD